MTQSFAILFVFLPTVVTGLAVSVRPGRIIAQPRCRVVCGWGPDPIWSSLTIASIADANKDGSLKAITIEPPSETAEGFLKGGQYLQIRQPGAEKAGIFAIASAPDATPFEFLIKETPPSDWSPGTGWLTSASAGTELEVSQVMGSGFLKSDDALEGVTDVLLFAAGSGISPIRSTIESGVLDGKDVRLYYGCRTADQMAYQDKFEEWAGKGVTVTPVLSKEETDGFLKGYVQDVCKSQDVITSPKSTAILLCGMKGMFEGLKELAEEAGIPEDKVMANF